MSLFDLLRAVRDMPMAVQGKLTATDKTVLFALVMRADANGKSWPSHARLAEDTWLTRRTIMASIRRLERAGLAQVQRRHREGSAESESNVYQVRLEVVKHDHHVGKEDHHVVIHDHHLGNDDHHGGDPASLGVVIHDHPGGDPRSPKDPNEDPSRKNWALTRPDEAPSIPIRRKPGRAPKHSPEEIATKEAIVAEFVRCCEAGKGTRPKKIHERDHAAAFALAKTYGPDEAVEIVRRAFGDDFVLTRNTTIAFIESKAETFRGRAIRTANGKREVQGLVGDEPWLEEHRK